MVEEKNLLAKIIQPAFVFLVYLFLYLPIVVLTVFSFNDSAISVKWVGFSLRWYKAIFDNPELLGAIQTSLIVAFSATVLSVSLGTSLVLASKWWRTSFWFNIFYVNVLLPEIILAIGLLSIFAFFNLPMGYTSLITGHTLLGLGFVIPIMRSRFVQMDPILTEASLDLGATYMQTIRKVYLPLLKPAIIAASLLAFTLSLDDFLIAFFCSSPSAQTLSVYIYSLARTGMDPTINAVSAGFLIISSVMIFILCFLGVADLLLGND